MRHRYEIVPLTEAHCRALAPRLRASDVAEIWAAAHQEPLPALLAGLRLSVDAWAGLIDGKVACAFGVSPLSFLGGVGCPWMLASHKIERHALPFLRQSRAVVAWWRITWPRMENHVDARNTAALRWLHWLGFRLDPAAPHGVDGLPFHRFVMEA